MNQGKPVFYLIMSYISKYDFDKCVGRYKGNYKVQSFTWLEHFLRNMFCTINLQRKFARY